MTAEVATSQGERLIADLEATVDPKTYDGESPCNCLLGQWAIATGHKDWTEDENVLIDGLSEEYDLDPEILGNIYWGAADRSYRYDLKEALAMARRWLQ